MESFNNKMYVGEIERGKLRENKTLFKTLYKECAQRAHLYKAIQTVRSIDTYFNAHQ